MPIHRKLEKLEKYLTSDTLWCPQDIVEYQGGGLKEGLCPLCDSTIDADEWEVSYADFKYKQQGSLPTPIVVNVCWQCSEAIADHSRESMKEYKGWKPSADLKNYVLEGILPHSAYSVVSDNRCIFCWESLSNIYTRLFVPVGNNEDGHDHLYGGQVYACEKCSDYAAITTRPPHHLHTNVCNKCEVEYPLTEFEYRQRSEQASHQQHLCPQCFHSKYKNIKERFLKTNCSNCSTDVYLDLSLFPNFNVSITTLIASTKCPTCRLKTLKYPIYDDGHVRGIVCGNNNTYYFTIEIMISNIDSGIGHTSTWEEVFKSKPEYLSVLDAASALDIYISKGGKQGRIEI